VAVRGPYDLLAFPTAPTYLITYGAPPASREALLGVLRGETSITGTLPAELPGLYPAGAGLQGAIK
jgi:beta-N-acetylhexosaminidase